MGSSTSNKTIIKWKKFCYRWSRLYCSHVVVELQNNGFKVVIIDDLSNSSKDVLNGIYKITGIKPFFEKVDMKEKKSLVNFF